MGKKEDALAEINSWYDNLPVYPEGKSRGSLTSALRVLEFLKTDYDLNLDTYLTERGGQIKGLTPNSIRKISREHGETRDIAREVGRTDRGNVKAVEDMLHGLAGLHLDQLTVDERNDILWKLQDFVIERIGEYHNRKKVSFVYDENESVLHLIEEIMKSASKQKKGASVAQYLVGAKLQLRFPNINISNDRFTAGDSQTARLGDFIVGDTVFHVSINPDDEHMKKCLRNIQQGKRVYVIVPAALLEKVQFLAESILKNQSTKVTVVSIEAFVAQNIDELAVFSKEAAKNKFKELIEKYNERVDRIESDKSKLIDVPSNL